MTTQKKDKPNFLDKLLVLSFVFVSISFLDTLFALNIIALVLKLEQEASVYSNIWFIGFWAFLWGLPLAAAFKDDEEFVGVTVGGDLFFFSGFAFIILMWQFLLAFVALGGAMLLENGLGLRLGFMLFMLYTC